MSTRWNRKVTVRIAALLFDYENCDIEFKIEKSNGSDQNQGEITLWNLDNDALDAIVVDTKIKVQAGYENDYGVIFEGTIIRVDPDPDGADLATIITCADISLSLYQSEQFTLAVSAGQELSTAVAEVYDTCSVPVGQIDTTGYTFSHARTFVGTGEEILGELVDIINGEGDTFTAYTEGGMAFFVKSSHKTAEVFEISSSTGLLTAEKSDDSTSETNAKITTLLNWKIQTDAWVRITSPGINGLFKVSKYTHSLKNEVYETEMEVAVP